MKKLFLIGCVIATVCICACKKDPEPTPTFYFGSMTAELNGEVWEAKSGTQQSPGTISLHNIFFDKFNDGGSLRNSVAVRYFPAKIGRFNLVTQAPPVVVGEAPDTTKTYAGLGTFLSDGDVAGSSYFLLEQDAVEDYLEITRYDPKTGEADGLFQASFSKNLKLDSLSLLPDKSLPDTVVFTKGTFKTKILK